MTATVWLQLAEAEDAPDVAGIYAWYYRPYISRGDLVGLGDPWSVDDLTSLIQDRFFAPLREMPYQASLRGELRPALSGTLEEDFASHVKHIVTKITDDGIDLSLLASSLEGLGEAFFAPLYIGISKGSLQRRLSQHVRLLRNALAAGPALSSELGYSPGDDDERKQDKAFAREVALRGLNLVRLSVAVQPLEVDTANIAAIEYILNRICFPLLGRR